MLQPLISLWRHRQLVSALLQRQLAARFQGSLLGRLWLPLTPLIMLVIYAFVFGQVLQARWQMGEHGDNLTSFALILFSGLLVHQFFAEVVSGAPGLILSNPNYVKKIIFPLAILPWVATLNAGVQALFSLACLLIAVALLGGTVHWSWLALPLVYLPLLLLTLGLGWLLAALGVFLRDLQQVMGFICSALLFLSPVFYPMSLLPDSMGFLWLINPLILIIEQSRQVIFAGLWPDWSQLGLYYLATIPFILGCGWVFQRSQHAFADVI